jgi:hypothetical protein
MADFNIKQGSTFSRVLRWESPTVVYAPITAIAQSAPVQITSAAHGIPDGWRVAVQSVQGMKQLNALNTPPKSKDYHAATVIDANTVSFNDTNALGYSAYVSGGVLVYNLPVDMASYTARLYLKNKITDTTSVLQLTTENGGITIDNVLKTIILNITSAQSAALAVGSYVYGMEMVIATLINGVSGEIVTPLIDGAFIISAEVVK